MKFVFLLISLLFSGQVFSKNIECYGAIEGSLPSGLYKNQAPHLHDAESDVSFMTVLNDKIVTFYFELNNNQYELEFRDCIALDEL